MSPRGHPEPHGAGRGLPAPLARPDTECGALEKQRRHLNSPRGYSSRTGEYLGNTMSAGPSDKAGPFVNSVTCPRGGEGEVLTEWTHR